MSAPFVKFDSLRKYPDAWSSACIQYVCFATVQECEMQVLQPGTVVQPGAAVPQHGPSVMSVDEEAPRRKARR